MRVGDVIEKWRQTRPLALEFGAESIRLMVLDPHGVWLELGAVTLTSDAFNENVQALARHAREMVGGASVELWLPRDQILNDEIALEAAGPLSRRAVALRLLAERTGAPAKDIAFDIARQPDGKWATAAADRRVVAEAVDYARRWGFAPRRVTTRHAGAFPNGPDLGAAPLRKAAPYLAAATGVAACALAVALLWPAPAPASAPEPQRIVLVPSQQAPAPDATPPPPEAAATQPADAAPTEPAAPSDIAEAPEPTPAPPASAPAGDEPAHGTILAGAPPAAPSATPPVETAPPEAPTQNEVAEAPEPTPGPPAGVPAGDGPAHENMAASAPPATSAVVAAAPPPSLFAVIGAPDLTSPFQAAALFIPVAALSSPGGAAPEAPTPALRGAVETAAAAAPTRFAAVDPAATAADVPPPVFRRYATEEKLAPGDAPAPEGHPATASPDREAAPGASAALSGEAATIDQIEGPIIALAPATPPEPPAKPGSTGGATETEEPDEAEDNPGAVAAAPAPRERPQAVIMSGSRYAPTTSVAPPPRPPSIRPRVRPLEAKASQIVAAPLAERPSSPSIARAATVTDAIDLGRTSLLGVFGKPNSRRAIVRLPSGEVRRVGRGETLDGWTVTAIEATSMKMKRGGETRSLKLIQ